MLITSVEPQKKDPSRVSVFIDGEFAFGMRSEDALFYGLSEGTEISGEKFKEILNETAVVTAKGAAIKYLGYGMRSRFEIEKYLRKREFSDAAVKEAVKSLSEYGYINDLEFAKAFVSDGLRFNKWGVKKINFELKRRGVSDETAGEAFELAEYNAGGVLAGLIEKKIGPPGEKPPDKNEKMKLFNYLLNKGFTYEEINSAYNKFFTS